MPSVYISRISNVTQVANQSNVTSHVQASTIFQATAQSSNENSTSYTTTTPLPEGLSPIATVFIALTVIVAVLCAVIFCICWWRKHHKSLPKTAPPNPGVALVAPHSRQDCLKPLCREYLNTLNLNRTYFDSRHDKCFCKKCHDPTTCEHWCKQQHDWVRFGLRVNQAHQRGWKIFKEWKTSYYGTSSNRLASILNSRFLPYDGDRLADGTTFHSGHPDPTQCTTSPSLVHASRPEFTSRSQFRARDGRNYNAEVVLQCKQKPDTYIIQGNTGKFHDTEWATVSRSTLIPYGLLVRLKK